MVQLENNSLHFRFPSVHSDASCRVKFVRTIRIPDDNREHHLPPGLGAFPLQLVDAFAEQVPARWKRHGGAFFPMYQSEAMWISFSSFYPSFSSSYPMALKIAAGKINAVTGEPWTDKLSSESKQDYVVIPGQRWLDGFYAGESLIRQFVAMEIGDGYTAEEQITGAAEYGGLQIQACPMKRSAYEKLMAERKRDAKLRPRVLLYSLAKPSMGLAPGGLMRQAIYKDPHGINQWDQSASVRCFVHIVNSLQYFAVTGEKPPTEPPTAKDYTKAGLPWFQYYDRDRLALNQPSKLQELTSVAAMKWCKGEGPLEDNEPVKPSNIVRVFGDGSRVTEWDSGAADS